MEKRLFRIATCKPAETLARAERLREMVGESGVIVAPSFRKTIRVGRLRRKRTVETPLLGGLIFIGESALHAARGPGGVCACRSDAAAEGGVVLMLSTAIDAATGDRHYAEVGEDELSPLVAVAAERNAAFDEAAAANQARREAKARGGVPVPEVEDRAPVNTTGWIGRKATLTGGLFIGLRGTVTAIEDGAATIDLDSGGLGSTMTVPVEMVQIV